MKLISYCALLLVFLLDIGHSLRLVNHALTIPRHQAPVHTAAYMDNLIQTSNWFYGASQE